MSSGYNVNMTNKTTSKQAFCHSCLHDYVQFHVDTTGYFYEITKYSVSFEDVETGQVSTYHYDGRFEGPDIILSRKDKCIISMLAHCSILEESL